MTNESLPIVYPPFKTVYVFDAITGAYDHVYQAQLSPVGADGGNPDGSYIEPVSATDIAPPPFTPNQIPVFKNGSWTMVPDFRGQLWFDQTTGAQTMIVDIGQPAANLAATPPPPSLAQAQATQIGEINLACQAALAAIVAGYPALETDTWPNQQQEAIAYTANPAAITPILSAIAAAANTTVAALAATVMAKSNAYMAASGAAVGRRQLLTAQIKAATSVPAVQSIVW